VLRYAPELNKRVRRAIRAPNRSWRVDETTCTSLASGSTFWVDKVFSNGLGTEKRGEFVAITSDVGSCAFVEKIVSFRANPAVRAGVGQVSLRPGLRVLSQRTLGRFSFLILASQMVGALDLVDKPPESMAAV
jgi:hypothetical protein